MSYPYKKLLYLLFTFIILMTNVILGQESENYMIKLDGERVELYGDVSLSVEKVFFDNKEGKRKDLKQKSAKVLVVGGRTFLNLNISKNMRRLQEVYAYNSEYVMTGFWQNFIYVYIWDNDYNLVEKKLPYCVGFKKLKKKNIKKLDEEITPYFPECDDLISQLKKNINFGVIFNNGISGYNCNGSFNPLKSYLKNNP